MHESLTLDQVLAARRSASGEVVNVDEPNVKLVVFVLGRDWFAFKSEGIREVLAGCDVFFLPGCPSSTEGVINVRGDIESVIDLRQLLQIQAAEPEAASRILIGEAASMRSGLRVGRVEEVMDVPESAVHEPPHTISDRLKPLVTGIVTFRDQQVAVLDLERLFSDYLAQLI